MIYKKNRKGQVSVEFAMVFLLMLMIFVAFAWIIPDWLRSSAESKQEAQLFLSTVKLHAVTASTAYNHYEATIDLPAHFNGKGYNLEILPSGDNLARIWQDNKVVARIDLPEITSVGVDATLSAQVRIQNTGSGIEVFTES